MLPLDGKVVVAGTFEVRAIAPFYIPDPGSNQGPRVIDPDACQVLIGGKWFAIECGAEEVRMKLYLASAYDEIASNAWSNDPMAEAWLASARAVKQSDSNDGASDDGST